MRFAAKLAPTLFRIARQKPLLTPTSINVLLSGGNISCEKARRNLGYVPRPFQQTIDDAVRWMQAHYPAKARRSRTRKRRMAQPSS